MNNYAAIPSYGSEGYTVPQGQHNAVPAPSYGSSHQWVASAIFSVSQTAVERCAAAWMAGGPPEGVDLDHENLMTVQGPNCLKCHEPLTPTNYQSPCRVQVIPLLTMQHH